MIALSQATLDSVGTAIAAANTAPFLWRKLNENSSIQALAQSGENKEFWQTLTNILNKGALTEQEQTTAYVVIAALLIRNSAEAEEIARIPGIKKLFWALSLLDHVRTFQATTIITTLQSPILMKETPSSATSEIIIIP